MSYSWTYSGSGATITNAATSSPTIDFGPGATSGILSVVANDGTCNSNPLNANITINDIPAQPSVITVSSPVCAGVTQTYSVTNTSGVTYTWTVPSDWTINSGQGTNSINVTVGATTGAQTIQVEPSNSCGVGSSRSLAVTVNEIPAVPGTINAVNDPVCANSTGNGYSIAAVPGATSYTWTYSGTGATFINGNTASPTINFAANATSGTLSVTANNDCGSSAKSNLAVTITPAPATPSGFTGNVNPCKGSVGNPYSVSSGAESYTWIYSGTGATINNGTTANPTINFSTAATNGTLSVTATNGNCTSLAYSVALVLNDVPAQPSAITGTTTVCSGTAQKYSVTNVAGVGYTWTVPADWVIVSGQNTSSINVIVGSTQGANPIQVVPSNVCGNGAASTQNITVNVIPAVPATINGSNSVCAGSNGNSYSVTPVPGTTSYTWTYSGAGATITGGTTASPTINFSTTATSGTLSVTANNGTCVSAAATMAITVNHITAQPLPGSIQAGAGTVNFSVATDAATPAYQWQYSPDNTTWSNIADGTPAGINYANENTAVLSVTPDNTATPATYYYRCLINTGSCVLTSNSAAFTLRPENDFCTDAIPLTINAPAINGTLINASYTATPPLSTTSVDVWYKFTPTCTFTHTITIAGFSGSQVRGTLYSGSCTTPVSVAGTANGTTTATITNITLNSGTTYYLRVYANGSPQSNFNVQVTQTAPSFTLNNAGTPAAGSIQMGDTNVELFGFSLTSNGCAPSFNFTAIDITATGTVTANDLSNFRIVYDVNNNGSYDAGELIVGGPVSMANPLSFTITGQTGIAGTRRYLLIADVGTSATATPGNTFTGSVTAANVSAGVTVSGTANGNQQIIAPLNDFCSNAVTLIVDDPVIPGTLNGSSVTAPFSGNRDVWYKFVACSTTENILINGYTGTIGIGLYTGCNTTTAVTGSTATGTGTLTRTVNNLTIGTTYYLRVYASNSSANNTAFNIQVTSTVPATATTVTGPQSVCTGTTVTYSLGNANIAGVSYNWSVPADWTINSGQGTFSITATVGSTGGNVTVTTTNSCNKVGGTYSLASITVNSIPSIPVITGPALVCAGNNGYAYSTATGAATYVWTYSGSGATINNNNTNNPSIDFSPTATSGNLTVTASNGPCASTSAIYPILVERITTQPGNVTTSPGGGTVYFSTGTNAASPLYQWQSSADGITWTDVTDGDPSGITYANGNSTTLAVTPDASTLGLVEYYRCVVTTANCTLTSNSAILRVTPLNDLCATATTLIVDAPAVSGTLVNSTFSNPFANNDIWYKFTPNCTVKHTITVADFSTGAGENVSWELYAVGCPSNTGAWIDRSIAATDPQTKTTVNLTAGTVYYLRVFAANAAANNSNFTVAVTGNPPIFTLDNSNTPPTQNVPKGTIDVTLYGFTLTPSGCATGTFDFTGININTTGTALGTDLSNFRIYYDANANGIVDAGEASVSGAGHSFVSHT